MSTTSYSYDSTMKKEKLIFQKIVLSFMIIIFVALLTSAVLGIVNDDYAAMMGNWLGKGIIWIDESEAGSHILFLYGKILSYAYLTYIPFLIYHIYQFLDLNDKIEYQGTASKIFISAIVISTIVLLVLFYLQTRPYFAQIPKAQTEGFLNGLKNVLEDTLVKYIFYTIPAFGIGVFYGLNYWISEHLWSPNVTQFLGFIVSLLTLFGITIGTLWLAFLLVAIIWLFVVVVIGLFATIFLFKVLDPGPEQTATVNGRTIKRYGNGDWYDSSGKKYVDLGNGRVEYEDD